MLINEKTWEFVRKHAFDDVRQLALQGSKDADVDLTLALQQIAGRQTAHRKLPSWAAVEGIVYPPHLNLEQCSSEQTARYKAIVVSGLSADRQSFVDLTGGFGVDFYFMSQAFQKRVYVEQNADLCAIVESNMAALGLSCSVRQDTASAYLTAMDPVSVIYLDPARRNVYGGRTYGIEDCTPNVLELLPLLMQKASCVILKLSPMLDWRKAIADIQQPTACGERPRVNVSEVHIVSVDNECKELLLVLNKEHADSLRLVCVNGASTFEFFPNWEKNFLQLGNKFFPTGEYSSSQDFADSPLYLYEPNASIMKAGCFAELGQRFSVQQVAQNSHLFLTPHEIEDFPGRGFQIQAISTMNKQDLKKKFSESLVPMKRANIAVRNFPMTADQLRKKLKLKDGGDIYIFATTASDDTHKLFICRKIS